MSNWIYLNQHRCTEPSRTIPPQYVSTEADGWNGMFRMTIDGKLVRVVSSDGGGWRHVSVSIEYETKVPTWQIMCAVKDLFWEDEDWVVQFHPAKSQYVNFQPGCLHLWQYTGGGPFQMPTPHRIMVGPKAGFEMQQPA